MYAKITMPTAKDQQSLDYELCQPYLVRNDDCGGKVQTAIVSPKSVLFFDASDGSITYSDSHEYLYKNFTIIRKYAPGETLSYTQGG